MGYGKCGKCGNLPYKKQKLLSPNGNLYAKRSTSSQKMATSMLKVTYTKCHYTELPAPLRTPQTSGHSSFCVSNLPLWSLKSPSSRWLKSSFFICPRVSARFQGMQWVLWLAKYDKGRRNCNVKNHDALRKNDVDSKVPKSEYPDWGALLIRGPGIRVPSSTPKSNDES